jgi:hypothetical protein
MSRNDDLIVCPSCWNTVDLVFQRCPRCNFPLGTTAGLDPFGAIHDECRVLVKATEIKPKPIVVLGVWILFLPTLLSSVAFSMAILSNGSRSDSSEFVFFLIAVGSAVLAMTFLFKVTRNYLKSA